MTSKGNACKAQIHVDMISCPSCDLAWDMNDPCPPACRKDWPRCRWCKKKVPTGVTLEGYCKGCYATRLYRVLKNPAVPEGWPHQDRPLTELIMTFVSGCGTGAFLSWVVMTIFK